MKTKLFGSIIASMLVSSYAYAQNPEKLNIYSLQGTCQYGWFGSGQCKSIAVNGNSGKIYYVTNGGSNGRGDNLSWWHSYLAGGGGGNGAYYFTLDAKQNDLIFGKDKISGGRSGTIKFNDAGANSYSSLEVKAKNIYIGGNIIMAHDSTGFKLGFNAQNGDVTSDANFDIRGTTAGVAAGSLIITAKNFTSTGKINLNGSSTHNGQTLDVTNVSNKAEISDITATRGNINANTDFNVTNLKINTADFNPTTDLIGNSSTKFNITNLDIFAGWGATTIATAKFTKGATLAIQNAKISNWSILDASAINDVSIQNLESSYATIKAGNKLNIENAKFSNNETFLYSKDHTTINHITLDNGAKLYIKEGKTLTAKDLKMDNSSWLIAQNGNGSAMSGDTKINQIDFNNSRIYANNLSTDSITIKNNAGIYLGSNNSGTYTNDGDLNISDGSKLEVFGNMINSGSLNLTLRPGNTELIHTHGSFQFNMDAEGESKKYTITNTVNGKEETKEVTLSTPKAKINLYTSSKDLITGVTYTLIKADGGINFKKDNKTYTYDQLDTDITNDKNDTYGTLSQILAQNIFFYDNTNGNKPMNVDFKSSSTKNILSFSIATQGIYVDITPYIKPGTWVFGIGSGNAIFGIMNGAGGLARDYTLTLEAKSAQDTDGKTKPVIYYLKDYTYHNSGNRNAIFTIDATGSKFVLGKNRETAGVAGKIHIGDALAKSNLKVKADSIYLGGEITLGDGALISGHIDLETTKGNSKDMQGFIGSNDSSHDSKIYIRNHSSLTAKGDVFNYQGTIQASGNGTVTDEVTLNLSGITGAQKITLYDSNGHMTTTDYGIYIHKLILRDAKKRGNGATDGGVSMKDFLVNELEIWKGNNTYSEFLTPIGKSKINTLNLVTGTSAADAAELRFSGIDSSSKPSGSLEIGSATLGAYSILNAANIENTNITQKLSITSATATFHNLEVAGKLENTTDSITHINGNLILKNGANFYLTSTIKPIEVTGTTTIYMDTKNTDQNNISQSIFNIYNLSYIKGAKVGTTYTLLESKGGITYHYTDSSGKESSGSDSGFKSNMSDRIGFYEDSAHTDRLDKSLDSFSYNGLVITKMVEDNLIGFKIDTIDALNPYNKNRIEHYFYRKGNQEWIDKINAIGPDAMEYFQTLMLDKNNALWANDIITANNLDYFLKVAKTLQDAANQIGSPTRKSSSLDALRLATDVNKNNRLVKLSTTKGNTDSAFARVIQKYKNVRFANADNIASDATSIDSNDTDSNETLDLAMAYTQAIRDTYKNNVWASVIGVANFIEGGNATLYGINAGYDRAFNIGDNRVIVGGYLAYAYSTYYGNLIQNHANNLNMGIYIRSFIPHGELDFSASETIGFNNEFIDSKEIITKQLNQSYDYQSYITNVNFNYGYLFYLQDKSLILKPQAGLSYFYIANSKIKGLSSDLFYSDVWANANADGKNVLTLNIALETRKYIDESSYWYVLTGISQDLFVLSKGDELVRFIGQDTLSYQKGDKAVNLHLNLTIGGELEIYKRTYLNLGLGSKFGVFYKDIGISGNVGVRYVF